MNKKIMNIFIILFCLTSFAVVFFKMNFLLIIPSFFILFFLILYNNWQNAKKRFTKQKEILNHIVPLSGRIEDFIILKFSKQDVGVNEPSHIQFSFLPIVQCIENGKKYITYNPFCYSVYQSSWNYLPLQPLKYNLIGTDRTQMNIGDKVGIYIVKELDIPFLREDGKINLNGSLYSYQGNVENTRNHLCNHGAYNVNESINPLEQNITAFEGIIDTSEIPKIENYQKDLHNRKTILLAFLVFFLYILFHFVTMFLFPNFI